MTSRARPGISKGLLAQLIALVRADEAGSVGDETEMVDLGGIAAAAVAERIPAALAARMDIQFARRKASLKEAISSNLIYSWHLRKHFLVSRLEEGP